MSEEASAAVDEESAAPSNTGGDSDESGKSEAGEPKGDDTEGNRLKRRNDELAGKWKEEKERANAAEAKLAEIEGEKKAAEEKAAQEDGRWQDVLATRDATIEELKGQLAERDSTIAGLENGNRERTIIDRLADAEGLNVSPAKVRRAYLGLVVDQGLERYPGGDDLEKEIAKREKLLRKEHPELFGKPKPKTTGGSPPPKGKAGSNDDQWGRLT